MKNLSTIDFPSQWQELDTKRMAGTVIVIGASDSGKSMLVRWLVAELCQSHKQVGWLDGDIGQTTLGLPTTMNLAVLSGMPARRPRLEATFFIGATSPLGHMLPTLVGLQRLRERALRERATAIVVDTTGLVAKDAGGGALKQWKIELLAPDAIIALQRGRELEHILTPLRLERRFPLHVLPVAPAAQPRSPERRASHRRRLFCRHFERSRIWKIRFRDLATYGMDAVCPGRILALQDEEGMTLALGVVQTIIPIGVQVLTPLCDLTQVASLRIGSLRIDPASGKELL